MFSKQPGFGPPTNASVFGAFGQSQNTTSPFGQPSFGAKPATSTFGQQSTGFQQPSLFSNTNQPATLFSGASSGFGGAATTTQSQGFGGGAFSQPQPNTSLFGASNPATNQNSLFGQSTGATAFGTKPAAFSGFNQPQANTSLFGQSNPTSAFNSFGAATNTNIFGTPPANASSFGQMNAATTGTGHVKYQPSPGSDTLVKNGQTNSVNTKQHCITAMKEYELKSLEELRFEDYSSNRKGPQNSNSLFGQQPQATTTGLFGAPAQSTTGLFNQPNDPSKSLFGASNTFGQTNTAFGQQPQQQQPGGFFQNKFTAPGTSGVGNTSVFSGFGTGTDNSNTFGAKPFTATTSTSLFGQPTQTANAFGQPGSNFSGFSAPGTNTQAATGLFGNPGTDNKSSFFGPNNTAPNTGFTGFGTNPATSNTGLFGNKPNTGFGIGGTGFGTNTSTAPAFGNTFGQTSNANTLFNNNVSKPGASSFANFGQTSAAPLGGTTFNTGNPLFGGNKPGGLFGSNTSSSLFGTNTNFGGMGTAGSFAPNTNLGNLNSLNPSLGQNHITAPIHQQILSLTTTPYGDNPIFKDLDPLTNHNNDLLKPTNPIAQKNILDSNSNQFKVNNKTQGSIKARPIGESKKSLFEGLEGYDSSLEESFNIKKNSKRLIIKTTDLNNSLSGKTNSKHLVIKPKTPAADNLNLGNNLSSNNKENISDSSEIIQQAVKINDKNVDKLIAHIDNEDDAFSRRESWIPNAVEKIMNRNTHSNSIAENTLSELLIKNDSDNLEIHNGSAISEINTARSQHNSHHELDTRDENNEKSHVSFEPHPSSIILTRSGYYTIPSREDLISYLDEEKRTCEVPNLTIGREGYGNVFYNSPIDIYGINFDDIVHFRHKEIIIYPDDDNKPAIGYGLNREAQVTLDQVWPHDKTSHKPIKDIDRLMEMNYEEKLRSVCDKYDTRFIEYRPETGSWVFRVKHFSKYGLSDSDEEVDNKNNQTSKPLTALNIKDKTKNVITVTQKDKIMKKADFKVSENRFNTEPNQKDDTWNNSIRNKKHGSDLVNSIDKNTNKLQLMKASFFVEDDMECDSIATDDSNVPESLDQIVPDKSEKNSLFEKNIEFLSNQKKSSITSNSLEYASSILTSSNVGSTLKAPSVTEPPRKIPNLMIRPFVGKLLSDRNIESSAFPEKAHKCLSDLGLFNCRRFKVTFGLNNSFLIPGTTAKGSLYVQNFSSNVLMAKYKNDLKLKDALLPHLKVQLRNSLSSEVDDTECPYLKSGMGTNLLADQLKESKLFAKQNRLTEISFSAWSLLNSLWGDLEELEGQQDTFSHNAVMRRREIFSDWLENGLNDIPIKNVSNYLDEMLELLLRHKVFDACKLAMGKKEPFLALLLSQLSGGPQIRQLVENQLLVWQKVDADEYVDVKRLKLLMLVGGAEIISSTHGVINIMEKLHWLTVIAVKLWYTGSPSASITDILNSYEKLFHNKTYNALPPVPDYLTNYVADDTECQADVFDIRYHILQLYSQHSYPMEKIINPLSVSCDVANFDLSWLIFEACESMGYKHCSKLNEISLHQSFADQLENNGLWEWSIFVLLHIKDINTRERLVQEALLRNITLTNKDLTEIEKFVINSLGVPRLWIDWAKALKAKSMNYNHLEAKYLLKSKQWNFSHQVIMKHIVAEAIINEQLDYLHKLLLELSDLKSSKSIKTPNWSKQGQIILDFIELNIQLEELKNIEEDEIELKWEQLKPQFFDLCSRINLLECSTAKQRLCQSEMAQKLACFIRGFFISCPNINASLIIKLVLEKLPLPQEFAQQELRILLHTLAYNMK